MRWVLVCGAVLAAGCAPPQADTPDAPQLLMTRFTAPLAAADGLAFGPEGWLTFELVRGGTFLIDGRSGVAWQRSDDYRDAALIRSTDPLPPTYTVRVEVGEIAYDLDRVRGLPHRMTGADSPGDENGCYLLVIADAPPTEHYANGWWHQHRKIVIDVDNNVWGRGMPRPIFMIYVNRDNHLVAWDGGAGTWTDQWVRGLQYQPHGWYTVQVTRTATRWLLRAVDATGAVRQEAAVPVEAVWHAADRPDYLVLGDPHDNYYEGSMQIRAISLQTPAPAEAAP